MSRLLLGLLLVGILVGGLTLLNNNLSISRTTRAEFLRKLDEAAAASRDWILAQGEGRAVLVTENPAALLANAALMHMVADCARLSNDERLQALTGAYFRVTSNPHWYGRMIDPLSRFEQPPGDVLRQAADYQRWFVYAVASTEFSLAAEDRANMFSPDRYRTGHATHQLFALYLYRKQNGSAPDLDRLIRHISERIAREGSVDFRVTDLYLQRVAFLLAAGQPDLIKRRWVERALGAQQPDGGWLYSWHGWQPRPYSFRFQEEESTSHPTAQGMWIAYMLKYRYPKWAEQNYPRSGR